MAHHVRSSADMLSPLVRHFIRQDYSSVDPHLPQMLEVLTAVGAAECWHKKSTFKAHLLEVYKILKMWGADDAVARCGLMHSAYSNSFVNLAIFKPDVERSRLVEIIGQDAEELTHLFCVVSRQQLLQVELLDRQPLGTADLAVPPGGMTALHIRTGEPLHIDLYRDSPEGMIRGAATCICLRRLGQFLLLTMADFAEQLMGWQDAMFGNTDGRLRLEGAPDPEPRVLWPGPMQPGLWMSAVSRMGRLLMSCKEHLKQQGDLRGDLLTIPPVFNDCTVVLTEEAQLAARELYWRVVSDTDQQRAQGKIQMQDRIEKLQRTCQLNPFVAEPHLMLAQLHLHSKNWKAAEVEAEEALRLFLQWGTAWDKRMDWGAWLAWTRVCLEAAAANTWPQTPLGVLSMGMVHGL